MEIINKDSIAMQHVTVEVTGVSYQIDNIPSGSSKSVKISPQGESAVTIKYSNITGKQHQIYIDTYIEKGYFGHIKVQIIDGEIFHLEQSFRNTPFF